MEISELRKTPSYYMPNCPNNNNNNNNNNNVIAVHKFAVLRQEGRLREIESSFFASISIAFVREHRSMHSVCHSLPAGRFFVRRAFVEQEAEKRTGRPARTRQCHRVCVSSNGACGGKVKKSSAWVASYAKYREARIGNSSARLAIARTGTCRESEPR